MRRLGAVAVGLLHLDRLPFTVCVFKASRLAVPDLRDTRALGRLFHGDLAGAFAMNPLAAVGLLALLPWAAGRPRCCCRAGRALSRSSWARRPARAARAWPLVAAVRRATGRTWWRGR